MNSCVFAFSLITIVCACKASDTNTHSRSSPADDTEELPGYLDSAEKDVSGDQVEVIIGRTSIQIPAGSSLKQYRVRLTRLDAAPASETEALILQTMDSDVVDVELYDSATDRLMSSEDLTLPYLFTQTVSTAGTTSSIGLVVVSDPGTTNAHRTFVPNSELEIEATGTGLTGEVQYQVSLEFRLTAATVWLVTYGPEALEKLEVVNAEELASMGGKPRTSIGARKKSSKSGAASEINDDTLETENTGYIKGWSQMSLAGAPSTGLAKYAAVWTGAKVIFYSGGISANQTVSGGMSIYERSSSSQENWSSVSAQTANTPSPARHSPYTAWTGKEMLAWGGYDSSGNIMENGGLFNPATNTWRTMQTAQGYLGQGQSVVWSGSQLILWGGAVYHHYSGKGSIFTYSSTSEGNWQPMTDTNAPTSRSNHCAVWARDRMIIWGGQSDSGILNNGKFYFPPTSGSGDYWINMNGADAPTGRQNMQCAWIDPWFIVWGGFGSGMDPFGDGGRYNMDDGRWTPLSNTNAPPARENGWTMVAGKKMIVWGGRVSTSTLNDGGIYDPSADSWEIISSQGGPPAINSAIPIWTGRELVIYGGFLASGGMNTSGWRYVP